PCRTLAPTTCSNPFPETAARTAASPGTPTSTARSPVPRATGGRCSPPAPERRRAAWRSSHAGEPTSDWRLRGHRRLPRGGRRAPARRPPRSRDRVGRPCVRRHGKGCVPALGGAHGLVVSGAAPAEGAEGRDPEGVVELGAGERARPPIAAARPADIDLEPP